MSWTYPMSKRRYSRKQAPLFKVVAALWGRETLQKTISFGPVPLLFDLGRSGVGSEFRNIELVEAFFRSWKDQAQKRQSGGKSKLIPTAIYHRIRAT